MEFTNKALILENALQGKQIRIMELEKVVEEKTAQNTILEQQLLEKKEVEAENEVLKKRIQHVTKTTNEFMMDKDIILLKGIEKFFWKDNTPSVLLTNYREWFRCMDSRLDKYAPIVHEEYVLVKVKCENPEKSYRIDSDQRNDFTHFGRTALNIFNKGWRHETASVYILHPNDVNKYIEMKVTTKAPAYHGWDVYCIPKEYRRQGDFFIILFLRKPIMKNA